MPSTLCPKSEAHVILNILYSCRSVAMKFCVQYPDASAIKRIHNLPPHVSVDFFK